MEVSAPPPQAARRAASAGAGSSARVRSSGVNFDCVLTESHDFVSHRLDALKARRGAHGPKNHKLLLAAPRSTFCFQFGLAASRILFGSSRGWRAERARGIRANRMRGASLRRILTFFLALLVLPLVSAARCANRCSLAPRGSAFSSRCGETRGAPHLLAATREHEHARTCVQRAPAAATRRRDIQTRTRRNRKPRLLTRRGSACRGRCPRRPPPSKVRFTTQMGAPFPAQRFALMERLRRRRRKACFACATCPPGIIRLKSPAPASIRWCARTCRCARATCLSLS